MSSLAKREEEVDYLWEQRRSYLCAGWTDKHGESLVNAPGRPRTRAYRRVFDGEGTGTLEVVEQEEQPEPQEWDWYIVVDERTDEAGWMYGGCGFWELFQQRMAVRSRARRLDMVKRRKWVPRSQAAILQKATQVGSIKTLAPTDMLRKRLEAKKQLDEAKAQIWELIDELDHSIHIKDLYSALLDPVALNRVSTLHIKAMQQLQRATLEEEPRVLLEPQEVWPTAAAAGPDRVMRDDLGFRPLQDTSVPEERGPLHALAEGATKLFSGAVGKLIQANKMMINLGRSSMERKRSAPGSPQSPTKASAAAGRYMSPGGSGAALQGGSPPPCPPVGVEVHHRSSGAAAEAAAAAAGRHTSTSGSGAALQGGSPPHLPAGVEVHDQSPEAAKGAAAAKKAAPKRSSADGVAAVGPARITIHLDTSPGEDVVKRDSVFLAPDGVRASAEGAGGTGPLAAAMAADTPDAPVPRPSPSDEAEPGSGGASPAGPTGPSIHVGEGPEPAAGVSVASPSTPTGPGPDRGARGAHSDAASPAGPAMADGQVLAWGAGGHEHGVRWVGGGSPETPPGPRVAAQGAPHGEEEREIAGAGPLPPSPPLPKAQTTVERRRPPAAEAADAAAGAAGRSPQAQVSGASPASPHMFSRGSVTGAGKAGPPAARQGRMQSVVHMVLPFLRRHTMGPIEAPPFALSLPELQCAYNHALSIYGDLEVYVDGAPAQTYVEAITKYTSVPEEDVIMATWKSQVFKPGHYVAVDRKHGKIVVCIRGTYETADILSDLVARPVPHKFSKQLSGFLHVGILQSSEYVVGSIWHAVRKAQLLAPGMQILVTGHSMGGAVAAVVALMLRCDKRLPTELRNSARAVCLAPAAVMDLPLSIACRSFCASVILGNDVVPRIGVYSVAHFVQEVARASPLKQLILRALKGFRWACGSGGRQHHEPQSPGAAAKAQKRQVHAEDALPTAQAGMVNGTGGQGAAPVAVAGPEGRQADGQANGHGDATGEAQAAGSEAGHSGPASEDEGLKEDDEGEEQGQRQQQCGRRGRHHNGRGVMPLYPPGVLLWVLTDDSPAALVEQSRASGGPRSPRRAGTGVQGMQLPGDGSASGPHDLVGILASELDPVATKAGGACSCMSGGGADAASHHCKPAYELREVDPESFNTIYFFKQALMDHLPLGYLTALRALVERQQKAIEQRQAGHVPPSRSLGRSGTLLGRFMHAMGGDGGGGAQQPGSRAQRDGSAPPRPQRLQTAGSSKW